MKVKGQLEQAQLENVQTVDEASLNTAMGMAYYNKDTNEILIGKNGSLGRVKAELPSNIVGDVRTSVLLEAEFQAEMVDNTWVLADGRDVTGSDYESITLKSTIPDLRGLYLRGKNNGRSDGKENPDGELAIGEYQADENKSHSHSGSISMWVAGATTGRFGLGSGSGGGTNGFGTDSTGGNESRPRSGTVNYFIKINR
jgi:hypothetical protein